eukprot:jgi/Mesvir1/6681/Mv08908-RA.1
MVAMATLNSSAVKGSFLGSAVPSPAPRPTSSVHHARCTTVPISLSADAEKYQAVDRPAKGRLFYAAPEVRKGFILGLSGALFRFGSGAFVNGYKTAVVADDGGYTIARGAGKMLKETATPGPLPEKPIIIYEFEGCPFCKKVREAVAMLDLDVLFYPTPKGGPTYRPKVKEMGGKAQFPYMVDPNTGTQMYESDDIIAYLFKNYGAGAEIPLPLRMGPLTALFCGLSLMPTLLGGGGGSKYVEGARKPAVPLELWGYEASAFTTMVKAVLCEHEIPYLYHSAARGSPKKPAMLERLGHVQLPYLEDPNTGVKMFESADIIAYIKKVYGPVGQAAPEAA